MDFLGVGPLEFIAILIIALIVLGPKDIAKTGRTLGRILRQIITSQWWSGFRQTSQELKKLPTKLMREANIEDALNSTTEVAAVVRDISQTDTPVHQIGFQSWTSPAHTDHNRQISPKTGKDDTLSENAQKYLPGG
jgi:Sec-independent protein translocase protein TatA